VIQRTLKIVKKNKGFDIDILKLNLNDQKVFEIFSDGDTTGVFQFESDGMRKYLRDLAPDSFEDLIAMVSLYRPGPLAYIPTYIDVKYKRKELKYLTDDLRGILENAGYSEEEILEEKRKLEEDLAQILDVSYGIAVYQEQLMFIVQYMAGFSLGEADLLRRGVGKKKLDVIEALKKEFIEKGANYRGYKPETTNYIYTEMIMPAANYSFNKSHAACYALIAYQTAFLKAYYPTEFLTSLMVSDEENMERIVLEVGECKSKGINVLPPDVNQSMKHFTYIDDKTIRFGLKAIKGIGDGPINSISNSQKDGKYIDLQDFVQRVGKEVINKKSLEALILSGSMDSFGERGQLYKNIENIIRFLRAGEKKSLSNQIGLFDNTQDEDSLVLDKVEPFTFEEKIFGEKQVIGFFISGHPLDGMSRYIEKRSQNHKILKMDFDEIDKLPEKQKSRTMSIQTVGYVKDIRKTMTKNGGIMAFIYCESFYYDFEITIFPKDFDKFKDKLNIDTIVIVNGGISINYEFKRKSILAREIKTVPIELAIKQARDLSLYDNRVYNQFLKVEKKEDIKNIDQEEEKIDDIENIVEEKIIDKIGEYIIKIPQTAKKQDLLDLKNEMLKFKSGEIRVFIDLKGQKIDTKISIENLGELKNIEKKIFF
ncbi:MAG: hypothetical protein NWP80_00065, partial [Candidatus Gracilibacteria bacterium]|nr:hypothetical protein [Candidatus Gracilibacteria bacterium]